jgi:hypothetical protein
MRGSDISLSKTDIMHRLRRLAPAAKLVFGNIGRPWLIRDEGISSRLFIKIDAEINVVISAGNWPAKLIRSRPTDSVFLREPINRSESILCAFA